MDQTSSGPTASSMGQAISIPVNLDRMGSDGGGASSHGASSPKGSRGRSTSREEQRIAAAERYAANVSRGRGSPAAGARRVTPPEDDPRFKLVEGDDPETRTHMEPPSSHRSTSVLSYPFPLPLQVMIQTPSRNAKRSCCSERRHRAARRTSSATSSPMAAGRSLRESSLLLRSQ